MQYKTAAIRALIFRAYEISSCMENFWKSYEKIQSIFINNGFHLKYIDKIRQKFIANITTEKPTKKRHNHFVL